MDGFRKEELVFVIGTTNFVEALDEALLRPGRFELKIRIPYPNEKDRRAILELYTKKFGLDVPAEVFDHIVRKTQGYANVERRMKFTGDHLYAICRGLAREVVRRGQHKITKGEVDDLIGETFEIRPPTKEEEKVIAFHECGHALAAALLPGARPPEKISLEGIEDVASGYTMTERRLKDHVITEKELRAEIGVLLGGRSAEMIVFGEKANGAANDLLRASAIARSMIETMGMSDALGPQSFLVPNEKGELTRRKTAELTEKRVDEEVERLIKEEQERVVHLIQTHRAVLDAMAEFVVRKRVLEKDDIKKFMTDHGFKVEWQETPPKELPLEQKPAAVS
jgi:cell division protease FtsH